jgi:hypothetical protein
MSECLHCDINDLVQKHIESSDTVDLPKVASMIVESLADFILSAPAEEQAYIMADALAQFGHVFLEKAEGVPGDHAKH